MITGIHIPQDAEIALSELQLNGLTDYQHAVGGYVELIHIDFPRLTMFANEEGKLRNLPVNRRATCLWWLFSPAARGRDFVVGDVVLVGAARCRQTTTELPEDLRPLLRTTSVFLIEARHNGDAKRWHPTQARFSNFFEAAIAALSMVESSRLITDVRVVGSK
jgi:hypothetical protein